MKTWWARQMRSKSCLCRNFVTISGPKVKDTPRSFSPHPITSLSGSDHRRSHNKPASGTSAGRAIRRICSIDCRSGLNPIFTYQRQRPRFLACDVQYHLWSWHCQPQNTPIRPWPSFLDAGPELVLFILLRLMAVFPNSTQLIALPCKAPGSALQWDPSFL